MGEIEAIAQALVFVPEWLQASLAVSAILFVVLFASLIRTVGVWNKNRAEVHKIRAETSSEVLDQFRDLLNGYKKSNEEFRENNERQSNEIKKLQLDNRRLHEATNRLIESLAKCSNALREYGATTDQFADFGIEVPVTDND